MGVHAFFAPSSAPRVVKCPGSLMLTMDMPDSQSYDAAHGTAAHWIADLTLRGGHLVERYAGCWVAVDQNGECVFQNELNKSDITLDVAFGNRYLFEVDDEMVIAVQEYCDWCNDTPGDKYPECRVDISRWTPKNSENIFVPAQAFEPQKGTSDHAACSPFRLVITDLKYGKGVRVYAEENEQAILYALGFMDEWDWLYDFEEIEIRICQPRLDHKDIWIVSRERIIEIGYHILAQFELALMPDAPFNPGEKQCRFCKASGACRAQKDYLSSIRALAFDDLNLEYVEPDIRLLTNEELVEAWRLHGFMQARYDAIVREMMKAIENGVELPGVRLAEINCHRVYRNQAEAAKALMDAGIPKEKLYSEPELVSPAKAEKLLPKGKREIVKTLVIKPRGGPTIVDADDKRPDYEAVVQAHVDANFDNLDDPFA